MSFIIIFDKPTPPTPKTFISITYPRKKLDNPILWFKFITFVGLVYEFISCIFIYLLQGHRLGHPKEFWKSLLSVIRPPFIPLLNIFFILFAVFVWCDAIKCFLSIGLQRVNRPGWCSGLVSIVDVKKSATFDIDNSSRFVKSSRAGFGGE